MKSRQGKLPSLSVLVATYNRADYLRIGLACLKAQDYAGDWQIIVADDGSTDHTAQVISQAATDAGRPEIKHCWRQHQLYRRAFILATVLTLALALLSVGWNVLKASLANPVNSLRYE